MAADLSTINDDEIIDRIAAGEYQSHIAKALNVPSSTLHKRISQHPGYKLALRCRNAAKLDDSQQSIETASAEDGELARAREAFKAAAWRAERECPEEWGQKVEHSVTLSLSDALQAVADRRQRERERTLDVVPETIVQPQQAVESPDVT